MECFRGRSNVFDRRVMERIIKMWMIVVMSEIFLMDGFGSYLYDVFRLLCRWVFI